WMIICFTTEVLEGFDVQRTNGYADTEKKYGHLTRSIIDYYRTNFSAGADTSRLCLTYDEFVKRCSDLEKVTVSDIFALQLMQVPQVTEEAALAVTSLYPTLLSLAKAYAMLDGDRRAQEEMLKNKSDMVNAGASKNIFKLIWAEG
uniref:Crossover junction endonuclease MUS81 n=1 Tax=Aegilops tauschii subsp. strangulata TaxID=200361 RepID=A0A453GM90_AEGTS